MSRSRPLKRGSFQTTGVAVRHDDAGEEAELLEVVVYMDSDKNIHIAYPGLFTDGRSGECFYYVIGTPYKTKYLRAYIIHDWYCAKAKLLPLAERARLRLACDKQLRDETLKALGAGWWRRAWTYIAVRAHAFKHRNEPVVDWREDFATIEASQKGGDNPL